MWGEGIGGAGQKRIDRLQKTIDNYQKQWGHLDQDEYDMKLKRRQDQLKEFKTQQTAYSNALAAQNIQAQKDRAAADAATQQRAQDRAAGAFSSQVRQDPGGGGTWHQQTRAKERQGQQVAGPGFGSGAYFNQGGRVGYSNGGRVGILSVF
jgi:DNA-binding protein H-NS